MRSRLAEGGALAMLLSPVCFFCTPRGAAQLFLTVVEAKCKISLTSPNGRVDQRKSLGCRALIGAPVPRKQRSSPVKMTDRPAFAEHRACAMVARRRPPE